MRTLKTVSAIAAIGFALSGIAAVNASASQFTSSATGEITGKALETQVFTTSAGEIRCSAGHIRGGLSSLNFQELHVTVEYTSCSAFGFPIDITAKATFGWTANGKKHIKGSFGITVTGGIFGECTITFGSQEVGTVSYANNAGKIKVTPNITGLKYTSTGGICGASGSNGTYKGASEIERVGGGSISWDA
jgi:hypothetical protein